MQSSIRIAFALAVLGFVAACAPKAPEPVYAPEPLHNRRGGRKLCDHGVAAVVNANFESLRADDEAPGSPTSAASWAGKLEEFEEAVTEGGARGDGLASS